MFEYDFGVFVVVDGEEVDEGSTMVASLAVIVAVELVLALPESLSDLIKEYY